MENVLREEDERVGELQVWWKIAKSAESRSIEAA
jgi:hypothetical protein